VWGVRTEDKEGQNDVKMPVKTVLSELRHEAEDTVIVAASNEVK
jgi:hypothetical protein